MAALPEDIEYGIQVNLMRGETPTLFQQLYLAQNDNILHLQRKWNLGTTGLISDLIVDYPYVRYTVNWRKYHKPLDAYYLALQDGLAQTADEIYDSLSEEDKEVIKTPTTQRCELIKNGIKAGYPDVA